jgi:hypothetical protein
VPLAVSPVMPASWTIYGLRGIWSENDAS